MRARLADSSGTLRRRTPVLFALICLTIVSLLFSIGAVGSASGGVNAKRPTVKFGIVLAETGSLSVFARTMVFGFDLAKDQLRNQSNGGASNANIQWYLQDNQGDRQQAISLYQQYINNNKVLALVGPLTSTEMFSAGPVAQSAGTVAIGPVTTAPGIAAIGSYIFTNAVNSPALDPHVINVAVKTWKPKTAAIIACKDDSAMLAEYQIFTAELKKRGVRIVDDETCAKGQLDFRPELTKIASSHPDVLLIAALGQDLASISLQQHEVGIDKSAHLIGALPANDPKWVQIANGGMEGMLFMGSYDSSFNTRRNKAFVKAYVKRFHELPTQFAAETYDSINLLAHALGQTKLTGNISQDRKNFRNHLAATKNFPGVLGVLSNDGTGQIFPKNPGVVLTVTNGKIHPFRVQ